MPDFSPAIALLRKPIEDLYSTTTGIIQQKIAVLRTTARMKQLHKKLYETQKVKTIWNTDRPISLNAFFYPVSIKRMEQSQETTIKLNSLNDLKGNHNIIFGTVGQGKSILLRYLLGKEIKSGTRIPILLELRNVETSTLIDALIEKFSTIIGTSIDLNLFNSFAESGKISFLLDGFDEVDPNKVQKIMTEIDELSYRYEKCRIILSSRPDSDCKHLTKFQTNKINALNEADLHGFYKKITKDEAFSTRICATINKSPTKIRGLITTPLLATLLAISYRTVQKIPLDFSEFYDEIFQILLIRHDASKLGWRRIRKSKLDDRQIQQIFEAFCFATRRRKLTSLDRETAYQLVADSIAETDITSEPQHFIDDIKKITCLLIDEAKKISFVHASVQEFFASRYIKTRTDLVAKRFYKQILDNKWENWTEELQFLMQIDSYRAQKHFFLPDIQLTLEHLIKDDTENATSSIEKYLNGLTIVKSIKNRDGKTVENFYVNNLREFNSYHYKNIDSRIFNFMFVNNEHALYNWRKSFELNKDSTERTYLEIAYDRGGSFKEKLFELINSIIIEHKKTEESMKKSITKQEVKSNFMDLSI